MVLSEFRYSIFAYGYEDDLGRGSTAYDMDAGEGSDDYEGGDTDDGEAENEGGYE